MKTLLRLSSAVLALSAMHAFAQDGGTTCDTVTTGTAIYTGGSTALQPFVKAVGPSLSSQTGTQYTLFYYGGGSCVGANNVVDPVANPLAPNSQFTYYVTDADGGVATKTCTLPSSQTKLDVAISDVFVETCTSAARPSNIGDFLGPAQGMVFVTSKDSSQTAITAEEAYIALGFGGQTYQAAPWVNDPATNFFIRPNTSGTKLILAGVIGVPVAKWKGKFQTASGANFGSGDVYAAVTSQPSTAAEGTLGILGLDFLDQNDSDGQPRRSKAKMLALAAKGQKYAFYPDSTKSSYDKKNLREGRYAGLGYAHIIANIGTGTEPVDPKVKYLKDLLTGATVTPAPSFNVAKIITQNAHLVPLCAMKVTRTAEGGPLAPYTPTESCGCYFESLLSSTAPAGCTACTTTCASGTCRNGWCESN